MGRNIWLDGIMGVVVGDALGVPVEFESREFLMKCPVTKMEGYGTYNLPAGTWSDDSSMTLATLDSLKNGWNLKDIMAKFALWLMQGEYTAFGNVFDVGNTCRRAIYRYCGTGDVQTCGGAEREDNGNGSLMRIMPVCLFLYEKQKKEGMPDDEAVEKIHQVSSLTHAHVISKMGCGLYYFIVKSILDNKGSLQERVQAGVDAGFAYYQALGNPDFEDAEDCYDRVKDLASFAEMKEGGIWSTGYIVASFEAALWCLLNTDSYEACTLKAVNLGSDTDTVAAIVGGLAGLYYGYDNIPADWLRVIQRREWIEEMCGRDFTMAE